MFGIRSIFVAAFIASLFTGPTGSLSQPTTQPPQTTAPQTTTPQTTAPQTTVPQTTAPQTTAPQTTAPQTTAPQTTAPQTTAPQTTSPRSTPPPPPVPSNKFTTEVLGGGSVNELNISIQAANLQQLPEGENQVSIDWLPTGYEGKDNKIFFGKPLCPPADAIPSKGIAVLSKKPASGDDSRTVLLVKVPSPPCWWPITQDARIKIKGSVVDKGEKDLFDETVGVRVLWFPLAVTLLAVALIYPGCAMVAYFLSRRRYERDRQEAKKKGDESLAEPNFWTMLDPVQITANPYGRASLAKLQIFLFSFIVFGILLFFHLRFSVLAAMSPSVLYLMGISAVGAVGGKAVYGRNRRIKYENWAWLRLWKWLPPAGDVQPRAKWRELFLDAETKEFDPYSFQMAVFSLVVAVALINTNLSNFGTFEIPAQMLLLLGLSQAVFIGGKGVEGNSSPFLGLDQKLDKLRDLEKEYLELKKDPAKATDAAAKLAEFDRSRDEAAEMFWAAYKEQLPERPAALDRAQLAKVQPGATPPP